MSRRRSPGPLASPTAKSLSFFPRTRFFFLFFCSSPLGTGGPTYSPPRAPIFSLPNRRTGRIVRINCELFDAVKVVAAAAGIRILIRSPLKALTLRDAIIFILIAVVLVPFGTAFWGAAFTVSNGFGTDYWIEWRNLGISNAVTTVVMVPALLLGAYHLAVGRPTLQPRRALEAALVIASA
jgi:integral membrane sensor domain MASE1